MTIGEELKHRRKKAVLTQLELCKLADVSNATLSKIENNDENYNISSLKKLFKALGRDVNINTCYQK